MGKKTNRLQGQIGGKEILILVDSGSSSNFISEALADQLKCQLVDIPATAVIVANGGKLTTTYAVTGLNWWTQGHTFSTDLKVLNIQCYDIILGMEWLEEFSQMLLT